MTDLRAAKAALRSEMLRRRAELGPVAAAAASAAIAARVLALPEWRRAATVMLYVPIAHEVDCRPLIEAALAAGKRLALPRVRSRPDAAGVLRPQRPHAMDAVVIRNYPGDLRPGVMRILEPAAGEVLDPAEIDFIGAPGLAFDAYGRRLGYGGGFYDRFLAVASRADVVGLCFQAQWIDAVPAGPEDRRVHAVVTEEGVHRCRPSR